MSSIGFLLFLSLSLVNIQSPSFPSIESFVMNGMNHIFQSEIIQRIEYEKILNDLFESFYFNCSQDLKILNPEGNKRNSDAKLPFLLDYIGKSLNDLADEIECQQSFNELVYYVIVIFHMKNTVNDDDESLLSFLRIKQFSVAGCVTQKCLEPLSHLLGVFTSFKNKNYTGINKMFDDKEADNNFSFIGAKKDTYEKIEYNNTNGNNYVTITIIWIFLPLILIKMFAGVIRLIYIPKGYEIHTVIMQHKQGEEKSEEKSEENASLFPVEKKELKKVATTEKKKDEYHFSSKYPLSFKIIHFFDLVEDMIILSTIKNDYYNDNGLGSIHFVRCCVLFFYVFFNTFNSLLLFPSKDILNKEFFSSQLMFIYRISTYSLISWVVLEAVLTSYKLMQFIKSKIYKDKNKNRNKNLFCELLIVYVKYIFLFIPKIFMFIFSFFIFYYKVELFRNMFDAKITFEYIKDYIITEDIECTKNFSCIFSIFNTTASKICYDFILLYVNFLICTFIFMIVLLILLKCKNKLIEFAIIFINLIIFVGFIFLIDDKNKRKQNYFGEEIYSYYNFKGNQYLTDKVYLLLGVYHFGFILGFIYFNYQNIKENKDKPNRNKNEGNNQHYNNDNNPLKSINTNSSRTETYSSAVSSNNNSEIIPDAYYPFSFFNDLLRWISKIKYRIRFVILFLCAFLIIVLSNSFRIHGYFKKEKRKEEKQKGKQQVFLDNYDRDYVLDIFYDSFMNAYFLFEKHIFLIIFFIINIILITLSDKGFYKSITKLKLIYAISRSGFIMVCLSYIFSTFSLCGFLVKIKFNIPTIVLISFGNFFITFMVSILLNAVFELQLKIGIKKILKKFDKKEEELEQLLLSDDSPNINLIK